MEERTLYPHLHSPDQPGPVRGVRSLQQLVSPSWRGCLDAILQQPSCPRSRAAHLVRLPECCSLRVPPPAAASQIDEVVLDTELPSLQYLLLHFVIGARVCGEQLRLPQLTSLLLYEVQRAALDSASVPVLEQLALYHIDNLECHNGRSFSSLTRLSYLNLSDADDNVEMAALLQLAPPSLHSMCVMGRGTDAEAAGLAACSGQLTSLYCCRPAIVPALGPLRQLEVLEVHASAAELAEHCVVLGGLPCLRKLICHKAARRAGDSSADLKVRCHAC